MEETTARLLTELMQRFNSRMAADPQIRAYQKKLKKGKMLRRDCAMYARALGKCAGEAAYSTITRDAVPNGILTWEIAENVLDPFFRKIFDMVGAVMKETLTKGSEENNGYNTGFQNAQYLDKRVRSMLNLWVNNSRKEGEADEQEAKTSQ